MAHKKNSKKDLHRKVARLKKRIKHTNERLKRRVGEQGRLGKKVSRLGKESRRLKALRGQLEGRLQTFSDADSELFAGWQLLQQAETRLEQEQTDISNALRSVQQQLDDLQQDESLGEALSAQEARQLDLMQITDNLVAKVRDLEDGTSLLERAGDELNERTDVLERNAAEIKVQQLELSELTRRLDRQSGELPALQEKFDGLTSNLNKLWAHTDQLGLSLSQQTHIATLLEQSKGELEGRTAVLEKELRAVSEQQAQDDERISRLLQLSADTTRLRDTLDRLSSGQQDHGLQVAGNDARLRDLELSTSMLGRSGEELMARAAALENSAAEAAHQRDELLQRSIELESRTQAVPLMHQQFGELRSEVEALQETTGLFEAGLQRTDGELEKRAQVLEERLLRLFDVLAGVEIQTALLTQQFEAMDADWPRVPDDEYVEAGDAAQGGAEEPDQSGAVLPADIAPYHHGLTARAGGVQETLPERAQPDGSGPPQVAHDAAVADQLSVVQRGLSELTELVAGLASGRDELAELQRSLQHKVGHLEDGQSASQSRLNGFLTRVDALDSAALGHAERSDDLINRLTARLEELQLAAGQTAGRLDETDLRESKLRASLEHERARIDGLQEADETLAQKLDSTINDTAALQNRVSTFSQLEARVDDLQGAAGQAANRLDETELRDDALQEALKHEQARIDELYEAEDGLARKMDAAESDALALRERVDTLDAGRAETATELERFKGEMQSTGELARQQSELLQEHASRLTAQQEQLEAAAADASETTGGINQRLDALDDARQALQEQAGNLGLVQVRQTSATQDLRQSLKRRTLLVLVMLLLLAATLGFLQFRGLLGALDPAPPMQAGTPAEGLPVTLDPEPGQQMDEVRDELTRLDNAVLEIGQSVEEIGAVVNPDLPGQVGLLAQNVASLADKVLQQGKENDRQQAARERARADMERLNKEVAALAAQTSRYPASVSAGQKEVQDRLQAEMDKIAGEVEKLRGQVSQFPEIVAAAQTPQGQRWARARQLGQYTLQLAGVYRRASLARFVRQQNMTGDSAIFHTEYQGRKWYALFHGIYETASEAFAAARQLPPHLLDQKPWVRQIPDSGALFPL